jgi:hypothetical protein
MVSSGGFDVGRLFRMPNGIFLSLSCGWATVYPVVEPFQPKPIRRGKAAQAKELVDNSQLNDTIIAHIDSAIARASQNSFCPAPAPPKSHAAACLHRR